MSLQVLKETGSAYNPVFLKILEDIPGGVTLKTNRFPTTTKEIRKGAMLSASASSVGLYNLVKTAKVKTASITLTVCSISVYPPQEFVVGDYIGIPGKGTAHTIAAITRGTAVDIIRMESAMTSTCATNTVLEQCVGGVHTGAALLYSADAILRDTVEVRRDGVTTLLDNLFVAAVVRGTVDESMLPYGASVADKAALTARIRFA